MVSSETMSPMGAFQAVGKGVRIASRLWFALPVVVVSYSAIGALATVFLPFQMVNGRPQVPPPATAEEALSRLAIGLSLFLCSSAFSLYWLGGTLSSARQLLNGQAFSSGNFFDAAGREFFRMLRWALALMGVVLGFGIAVAALMGLLWVATGRSPLMKALIQLGFTAATLVAGISLLFSPVILFEQGQGVWMSFRESWRFSRQRAAGVVGLLGGVVLVGVAVWLVGTLLAAGVGQLRQAMGIAPFAKGWPVFFFGWILGLPQAFLTLFIPASLYAYCWGQSRSV